MSIDQERVSNVPRNDRSIINIDIINVIYYINALALTRVGWLDDPNILLRVVLLKLLIVSVEVTELIREDVGVRNEVKVLFAEFLLHTDHVKTKTIFSCYFVALREVIDFLVFVETFVEITLARTRAP